MKEGGAGSLRGLLRQRENSGGLIESSVKPFVAYG
jgi:hypothetical protein